MNENEQVRSQLQAALAECARLREENSRLQAQLGIKTKGLASTYKEESVVQTELVLNEAPKAGPNYAASPNLHLQAANIQVDKHTSPALKVKLFRSLFRGREDVYAIRFIGKDGKPGYCPAKERRPWSAMPPGLVSAAQKFGQKDKYKDDRKLLPLFILKAQRS